MQHAVELDPGDPSPLFWLGRVHFATGRLSDAERDFHDANVIKPDVYEYHYWLGLTMEKSADVVGARREYQEAVRLDPRQEQARQRLSSLQ